MGMNKKRIAERKKAAEAAAQKERNAKIGAAVSISLAIVAALAVIVVGIVTGVQNAQEEKAANKVYYADIVVENHGTITVELDRKAAPITVDNFVKLANEGFYNGLTFHRIIDNFMMQGGCPEGTGYGDAGYEIKGEFSENGWDNPIKHERGVISMARGNEPDSGSCQFFIVHQTSVHLDGKYAAFGRVTAGMEIVDTICAEAEPIDGNGTIPAAAQPKIVSITIREK